MRRRAGSAANHWALARRIGGGGAMAGMRTTCSRRKRAMSISIREQRKAPTSKKERLRSQGVVELAGSFRSEGERCSENSRPSLHTTIASHSRLNVRSPSRLASSTSVSSGSTQSQNRTADSKSAVAERRRVAVSPSGKASTIFIPAKEG